MLPPLSPMDVDSVSIKSPFSRLASCSKVPFASLSLSPFVSSGVGFDSPFSLYSSIISRNYVRFEITNVVFGTILSEMRFLILL